MSGIGIAAGCKPVASAFLVQVQVGSPLVLASGRRIYDYKLIKICRAFAGLSELAQELDLGSSALRIKGSNPLSRTIRIFQKFFALKKFL